jgi:predicted HTH domain antitoxin
MLELPRESVASLGENDAERQRVLRLELALTLYREGKLSPGCAAQLAGMDQWDLLDHAKARRIATPYTSEMIKEDFSHARSH